MKPGLLLRTWACIAFSVLSCGFVAAYSHIRFIAFKYCDDRSVLIGICELLVKFNGYSLVVPFIAAVWAVYYSKSERVLLGLGYGNLLFSAIWLMACILAWELQQIPLVGLDGFK